MLFFLLQKQIWDSDTYCVLLIKLKKKKCNPKFIGKGCMISLLHPKPFKKFTTAQKRFDQYIYMCAFYPIKYWKLKLRLKNIFGVKYNGFKNTLQAANILKPANQFAKMRKKKFAKMNKLFSVKAANTKSGLYQNQTSQCLHEVRNPS